MMSDKILPVKERPKITLDNNCIINLLDASSTTATSVDELYEIIRLGLAGDVEIAITTRVEADLENDRDIQRRTDLLRQIRMFPVVGTVARFSVSKWGRGDVYAGDESNRLADDIQKIVFPGGLNPISSSYGNKQNDIDHLVGHALNGRDVFVTDDGAILRKAVELKRAPGIVVMTPAQCTSFLHELIERQKKIPLQSDRAVSGYLSKELQGRVSFDYNNNNGSYVIGDGIFLFKTKWSGASGVSIWAYNDGPSVDSIALAKGVKAISEVSDGSQYDFSSRARGVGEGQVIILQNTNGFYAAIRVIDVEAEDRGDASDQLTFEYVIQTNGSADFSGTL